MNEDVRARVLQDLENNLRDFERYGNDEFEGDNVLVNVQTVRQVIGLLRGETGLWQYYVNEEGKARWKCSKCGKIITHKAHEKLYCSRCRSRNYTES